MTDIGSGSHEEQALNTALEEATPLLAESLQRAERDHRRKRRLLIGGLIMLVLSASIVASLVITAGEPHPPTEEAQGTTISIEQFEEVVESEAVAQQGWDLWGQGKYAEAAQQFVKAIKAEPESPNLWNGLGWSLFHTGQREKAADAFRQCLSLDENWQAAMNGLGQIAYAQRDYPQAKEWFLKANNAPASQFSLVRVYLLTEEYERARTLAEQLLPSLPEDSDNASIRFQHTQMEQLLAAAKAKSLPHALRQQIEPALETEPEPTEKQPAKHTDSNNLLTNGGFERGTKGWIIGGNSGRMKLSPDHEVKTEGKQGLKVTKTGGVPIDIVRINAEELVPGQGVRVSADIKADRVGNAWMKFFVWDVEGNTLIEDLDVTRIHGTHDWRTASKTFTLPERSQRAAIQFWIVLDGTLWIDDVRIEAIQPKEAETE